MSDEIEDLARKIEGVLVPHIPDDVFVVVILLGTGGNLLVTGNVVGDGVGRIVKLAYDDMFPKANLQ